MNRRSTNPLLFIDVNFGKDQGVQRLILYEDDKPDEVAQRFSEKHNLPQRKTDKLS